MLEDEGDGDDEDDDDDEPINPLVDALFDEIEALRLRVRLSAIVSPKHPLLNQTTGDLIQLFETEMRCATIEIETREEVMREMEERMQKMENIFTRRLKNEVCGNLRSPIYL